MSKCGKSFMPECKYFTTGGCVSPFNCPYKIDSEYVTTSTSTPLSSGTMIYDATSYDKDVEIARLTAENQSLRDRLVESIELPRIIHPNPTEWHVQYQYESGIITSDIYYSEAKAEARLAELKGGEGK